MVLNIISNLNVAAANVFVRQETSSIPHDYAAVSIKINIRIPEN
jgi:hypothetical protein